MTKRLRILAGPNGSGKTSVYNDLCKIGHPNFGIFVNADKIELELKLTGTLDFRDYKISVSETDMKEAYLSFRNQKAGDFDIDFIKVTDNFLVLKDKSIGDSYFACFLAGFIRDKILEVGVSPFTIETVMSHPSKLDFMEKAKRCGYRVYLYYVTTDSPMVNVSRVAERVSKGGHDVPENKINDRYYRSLDNLYGAIKLSDRAYLFDNSGKQYKLLAEYEGISSTLNLQVSVPSNWLKNYVLDKIVNNE